MKDLDLACRCMFEATLLGAGYHHSRRTWRFRRVRLEPAENRLAACPG
jgi:hypothetical protein